MILHEIKKIAEEPELILDAANWYHEKWGIPLEAYLESMQESLHGKNAVPQWYVGI